MGRRRRRLTWTVGILVAGGLAGAAVGLAVHRANRVASYRPGERHAEITTRLDSDLPPDAPVPRIEDVTGAAGLAGFVVFAGDRTSQLPEDMGPGAAWGDFDGDGDDDLFLVAAGGPLEAPPEAWAPSRLYRNLGDGRFEPVVGFPDTRILGMGAAWGDADGDGDLDLALSGFDALRLYRNEGGRFVRDPAFAEPPGFWAGLSWADYDRDGDLDLYVCGYVQYQASAADRATATMQYGRAVPFTLNPASYPPARNLLLRNRGDGRFDDVATDSGVDNPQGRSLGALWHDFDGDGLLDLYVANDISDNALFINRGKRFEDTSHAAWVADYRGAMGLAAGDWDRDGDDDLFITHWIAQENALYDSLLGGPGAPPAPLRFMDVADQRGLGQIALQVVGWGAEFADLDADGWLDLVVANGSTFETDDRPPRLRPQPSFLFWSRRGEHFYDLAPLSPVVALPRVARGLALSDYDLDGDLDVLIVDREAGPRLWRNGMETGSWIELRLRDARGGSAGAVGASVVAHLGAATLRRTVGSVSYLSQSSATVHLGLGEAVAVERLELRWPDGGRDEYVGLAAGSIWELTEGDPAPRRAGPGAAAVAAPVALDREATQRFWAAQRKAMRAIKVDGDVAAAIPLFEEALSIDPGHFDSLYYLGNCLAATGDVDGALARLERLIELDPLSHRAHKRWGVLRAVSARDGKDLELAQARLERALAINPEETGVLHALGEVALLRGDLEAARRRLELETRTNPHAAAGVWLLGYVAWKRGDAATARGFLERSAAAHAEGWRPPGVVAEGDVRRRMHTEDTPLEPWTDAWDGALDPAAAYAALDARLAGR